MTTCSRPTKTQASAAAPAEVARLSSLAFAELHGPWDPDRAKEWRRRLVPLADNLSEQMPHGCADSAAFAGDEIERHFWLHWLIASFSNIEGNWQMAFFELEEALGLLACSPQDTLSRLSPALPTGVLLFAQEMKNPKRPVHLNEARIASLGEVYLYCLASAVNLARNNVEDPLLATDHVARHVLPSLRKDLIESFKSGVSASQARDPAVVAIISSLRLLASLESVSDHEHRRGVPTGRGGIVVVLLLAILLPFVFVLGYMRMDRSTTSQSKGGKDNPLRIVTRRTKGLLAAGWPLLLVTTWLFANYGAHQEGVFHAIDLEKLGGIYGQAVSFKNDYFYTIFQFFWVPFSVLALRAFSRLQDALPHLLTKLQADEDRTRVVSLATQASRVAGGGWAQVIALAFGAIGVLGQAWIQVSRIHTHEDVFWWDWRISPTIWIVRAIMLGIDFYAVSHLIIRGTLLVRFVRRYCDSPSIRLEPFHPDRACGLSPIGSACLGLDWALLVCGFFLTAAWILHHGLPQYLVIDSTAIMAYAVVSTFVFFYPVVSLHRRMKQARTGSLEEVAGQIDRLVSDVKGAFGDHKEFATKIAGLEKLQSYSSALSSMPTWAFNIQTLERFGVAVGAPFIMIFVKWVLGIVLGTGVQVQI